LLEERRQLAFEDVIDLTYAGGIERGRRNPSLLVMARIAAVLAVPLPSSLVSDWVLVRQLWDR
jgi:hypothetical protein